MTIQEPMTSSRWRSKLLIGMVLAAVAVVYASQAEESQPMIANGQIEIKGEAATFQALSTRRIYFGHQSVGADIAKGIQEITGGEQTARLHVVETADPAAFGQPVFAHSHIAENGDPDSKIDQFAAIIRGRVGDRADTALFKLCYIDIVAGTDVQKIFSHYKETLSQLKKNYPVTRFVHVTVPLTTLQTGPKAWVKRALGRPAGGYEDNIARSAYNELVRKEYAGREPIFDLAKIESTFPDGKRSSFLENGSDIDTLVPAYTTDGGHLNELGRRRAAQELLHVLEELK
jgi:hypothetical protein